jgi:hypothetical protein
MPTMSREKQLALARVCGAHDAHDMIKDVLDAQVPEGSAAITAADVFMPLQNGKSLFDYEEAWINIDGIAALVRNTSGEEITAQHFLTPDFENKAPASRAKTSAARAAVFGPKFWKDPVEMELQWLKLYSEDTTLLDERMRAKRLVAWEAGVNIRELQLEKWGITFDNIKNAIKNGSYDGLRKHFAVYGDYLRVEDVLLLDGHGDHRLDSQDAWRNFEALTKELARNGQRLSLADYKRKIGSRNSIIEEALFREANGDSMAKKIFVASLWKGRLADMIALYACVPPKQREKIEIGPVLRELVEADCMERLPIDSSLEKSHLLAPLNTEISRQLQDLYKNDEGNKARYARPVVGLGLPTVWSQIDSVRAHLAAHGEKLMLDDLRTVSGTKNETCLQVAARAGRFADVMAMLDETGERLTLDDLKYECVGIGAESKTLLGILAEKNQLGLVFQSRLWIGRAGELAEAWKSLPAFRQGGIEIQTLLAEANQASARQRSGDRRPAPRLDFNQ